VAWQQQRRRDSDVDDDPRSVTSGTSQQGWSRSRGWCFECGKHGHIAKLYREQTKKEEVALVADAGDAPALL